MIAKKLDSVVIFTIVAVVLVGAILFFLEKNARGSLASRRKNEVAKEVELLRSSFKSGQIEGSFAVIKADTAFDNMLKAKVAGGTSLGERLKLSQKYFRKDLYNRIWEAHKVRNKIVHENISIHNEEADKILLIFLEAIRSL